ncbi:FKBP-type peptidyl-prolyl cis-trans isomerase [Leadbetterella sp. DM7]|uniref:FKBP-type peptidyl-prolyl cis-trans isomerase n=1 Tax=Leadbetterella sp. DM7 TaxID=3235085 RepID=UPI00349ECE90
MKLKLSALVLLTAGIISCNQYKVTTTEDGDRLQVHEKGKSGKLAKDGDIIKFDLVIKTAADSVIKDSYAEGTPFTVPIQKGYFKGSFENALYHIGEGDSTTVLVSADTLFKMMGQPVPPEIGVGTDIRFIVKMHQIQSMDDYKKEAEERKANEPKVIQEYVAKNMKGAQKMAEGDIYHVQTAPGSGDLVQDGDVVKVKYVGKFTNGEKFDYSKGDETITVKVGDHGVIPGWEIALKTMKKGGKSTIIIPSALGYGEQGAGPIAPNTPLVFDIEVVDVVKK